MFTVLLRVCGLTGHEKLAPRPPRVSLPTPPPTQNHSTNRHRVLPVARRPCREPSWGHNLGRVDRGCTYCGALHWLSERSTGNGSSNPRPLFTMCCNQGEIELPAMETPPEGLTYLFTAAAPQANHFRQYNAALAFTSLGVEVEALSTKAGEYLLHSVSMVSCIISSVLSFHVTENVLYTLNCISTTRVGPSNIGCNVMQHFTRSSWNGCRRLSSDTTAGLESSSMLRRSSREAQDPVYHRSFLPVGTL